MANHRPLVMPVGQIQQFPSTGSNALDIGYTSVVAAIGAGAGSGAVVSGTSTIFFGANAGLNAPAVGSGCIAVGANALSGANVTTQNVCVGGGAGLNAVATSDNVAIGASTMRDCTVGAQNVFLGGNAGFTGTLGDNNLAIGASAMRACFGGGAGNVGIGGLAFFTTTIGSNNVAIGLSSGRTLASASASSNVFIGANAGAGAGQKTNAINSIAIGSGVDTTADNQCVLGPSTITSTLLRGVLTISDIAAPGSNPVSGVFLYSQAGELKVRDASGQITNLSSDAVFVSITDYGAVGDDSTINTAAIQAAIDDMPATGGIIFIPIGTYLIGGTLNVGKPIVFIGEGDGSIIKANAATFNVFTLSGAATGIEFSKFAIYGAATTNATAQHGIFSSPTAPGNVTIQNMRFSGPNATTGLNNAVKCDTGSYWIVRHSFFERLIGTISNTGYGCLFSMASRFKIHNNTFLGATGQGRHAIYLSVGNTFGHVHDNLILSFNEAGIAISASALQTANDSCVIHNNIINGGGSGTTGSAAIELSLNSKNFLISDNLVDGFNGDGILIDGLADVLCLRNRVIGNIVQNCHLRGINVQGGAIQTSVQGNTVFNNSQVSAGIHAGIRGDAASASGSAVVDQLRVTGNIVYGTSHRASFQAGGSAPLCTNLFLGPDNALGAATVTQIELNGTVIFGWHGASDDKFLQVFETTAPATPPANSARLFLRDNGSGKSQLAIKFDSGSVQNIETDGVVVTRGATAAVADGGTITHGLGSTPTVVLATGSVAGEIVSVTALGATTFTVAIKLHDGTAGTSQTIYWQVSK